MPNWKKSPESLTQRFQSQLPPHPEVEPKKMFGYACAFVRGNFWIGLHEDNVVIRLPVGLHTRFKAIANAQQFDPMGGRPMTGWYLLPRDVIDDDRKLGALMAETLPSVLALPPKEAKAGKTTKAKKKAPAKKTPASKPEKKTSKKATKKKSVTRA